MVGEIRDKETAEIAIQAGQTGHYVLSTIHTIDAVEVITRLRKIGVPDYDIASTVATTISQRLIRRLCPKCKQEREFSEHEKEIIKKIGEKYGIEFDYENYVYDTQADTELMKKAGQELAEAKVDLVISIATPPTVAMKDILAENKINMLFRAVSDPISAKVIDSFERPGQYITGTSDSLDGARLAQVALAAVPDAKKIGLLYNKAEFSSKMPIGNFIKIALNL